MYVAIVYTLMVNVWDSTDLELVVQSVDKCIISFRNTQPINCFFALTDQFLKCF